MSKLQTNRSYFYLLLADRIFVVLLFLFLFFGLLRTRTGIFVVVLFFLYQAVMLAVFCIRFLGPLREIEKISEMIAQPERHMADLEGGRPIHRLIQYVKQSVENEYTSQMLASQAEIHALQSQINPHFLFNTLNSINRTVMLGRREQALTMLDSLSVLLRYNLADAQMPALLGEELGITEEYLKIQKMRFSSRLNVDVRHDRKLEQAVTLPRFTLQPLVENAVIHGLEPKEEGGTLILDVRKTGNYIRIRICDNGMGIEKERLERIRRRLSEKQPERIGVWNIWQRLSLYTGRDDSLKIMSKKGAGTIVSIYLHRGEEDV